jgi:diacylglycerol kinase (ATP)
MAMKKKKILFVINPKSGVKGKKDLPALIESHIDKNAVDHEIVFTNAAKHGIELSREAALKGYDAVIAVGGDGSVNEIAQGLMGSGTALGFIATGSGNGMARHMKIPMNHKEAIGVINTGRVVRIDTFKVNDAFCVGTFGIGFDAHTAHMFAKSSKRGYSTYAKIVLTEFYKYKPVTYEITADGEAFSKECFLLTIANSSQFGNDARIAPFADVQDGLLDVSMISRFPFLGAPLLIYRLMHNAIHKSRYFSMKRAKEVTIKNNTEMQVHIDGEPITFATDLHISIVPLSLNVLVPQN